MTFSNGCEYLLPDSGSIIKSIFIMVNDDTQSVLCDLGRLWRGNQPILYVGYRPSIKEIELHEIESIEGYGIAPSIYKVWKHVRFILVTYPGEIQEMGKTLKIAWIPRRISVAQDNSIITNKTIYALDNVPKGVSQFHGILKSLAQSFGMNFLRKTTSIKGGCFISTPPLHFFDL